MRIKCKFLSGFETVYETENSVYIEFNADSEQSILWNEMSDREQEILIDFLSLITGKEACCLHKFVPEDCEPVIRIYRSIELGY